MASRRYGYAESLGESTYNADTTYQTKVSLTKTPSASSTAFIFASGLISNNSLTPLHKSRLYNSTTATVLAEHLRNPKDTTDYISFHAFAIETFGGSPSSQTWRIDYGTSNTAGSTLIKEARLSYLELDAAEFFEATAGNTVATDTTPVTLESMTQTLANGVDYYILCCTTLLATSTASSGRAQVRAVFNATNYGSMDYDFGQTTEQIPWMTILKVTGDGTSKTISVTLNSSGTSDVSGQYTYIAAFRADKFPGSFYDESRARSTTTTASDQDKVTSTHTPVAQDYLSFACGIIDINSTTSSGQCKFVKGATNYGEHLHEANTTGASGGAMSYGVGVVEAQAASSTTWKTQYRPETAAVTAGFGESAILHLQVQDTSGTTGTAAITEAGDAPSATGKETISGTSAVTETGDSPTGVGIGGVTGPAAVTEAGDSPAAAGTETFTGTSAVSEAGDTPAATGAETLTGTSAVTEGGDSAAGTGLAGIRGASAVSEDGDTPAASGLETCTGTGAITEAGDDTAESGIETVTGTSAITEDGDIPQGTQANDSVTGTSAISEAGDSPAGSGTEAITGTTAVSEDGDSLSGTATQTFTGTSAVSEAGDSVAGTAAQVFSGSGSVTESGDSPSASGLLTATGTAPIQENGDIPAVAGTLTIAGSAAVGEDGDSAAASGTAASTITGTAAITEDGDAVGGTALSLVTSGLNVVRVAAEDRTVSVSAQDRIATVANDNRILIVAARPRTVSVNSEPRVIRVAA